MMLAAALEYAAAGIPVFPVEPKGKRPLGRLAPHGVKDASTDEDRIHRWWTDSSDANVAIATGEPSGIVVIDLDGEQGETSFGLLLGEHGPFTVDRARPDGAPVRTGSGWHLWTALPAGVDLGNSASKLGPGIDVRATGGYVLAPPSVHPSGRCYVWRDALRWPLPELAPWVLEALTRRPTLERAPMPPAPPTDAATKYGREAARQELRRLAEAPEGTRNHALNAAAFALGQLVAGGELPHDATRSMLIEAGERIGLERGEIVPTIDSGLSSGMQFPRRAPGRKRAA